MYTFAFDKNTRNFGIQARRHVLNANEMHFPKEQKEDTDEESNPKQTPTIKTTKLKTTTTTKQQQQQQQQQNKKQTKN